jgi:Ca-activated chloride channel family protein
VGDDVNATMLDQLADMTRAVSTYVRPAEDIQAKVAGLYAKVSNPVLSNLKIVASNGVQFSEVYPTQLPDLFQGGQIVVLGRYTGKGPAAITLSGQIGKETKEFVYEFTFPEKTGDERNFVEQLWARRKVGFMLDQIRANGEKKELVDEVVVLAKKYGITTPYTSYLIVPDGVAPTAGPGGPRPVFGGFQGGGGGMVPPALRTAGGKGQASTEEFARAGNNKPGNLAGKRDAFEDDRLGKDAVAGGRALAEAKEKKAAYDDARRALNRGDREGVQAGKLGVDLSIQTQNLRNQSRLEETAAKNVLGRNVLEVGGVWIDEGFVADTKAVTVKAQSEAYFAILQRHAKVKDVFQLGNHVVWVTPSGVALVVDTTTGQETMSDAEIDKLFVAKK